MQPKGGADMLSNEELADSVIKSRIWRQSRSSKFTGDPQSQYLAELVRDCLEGIRWIQRDKLNDTVEAVVHIIRQRMATKAAATRKRNRRRASIRAERDRQHNLF
jgi:hypothetical protein